VSGQFHIPAALLPWERAPATHWRGGWVNPRAGLDDVEKRKFLTLPGLELRPLGRIARSQSLYRLGYPGSCLLLTQYIACNYNLWNREYENLAVSRIWGSKKTTPPNSWGLQWVVSCYHRQSGCTIKHRKGYEGKTVKFSRNSMVTKGKRKRNNSLPANGKII
jgi:hypothetical protein